MCVCVQVYCDRGATDQLVPGIRRCEGLQVLPVRAVCFDSVYSDRCAPICHSSVMRCLGHRYYRRNVYVFLNVNIYISICLLAARCYIFVKC